MNLVFSPLSTELQIATGGHPGIARCLHKSEIHEVLLDGH